MTLDEVLKTYDRPYAERYNQQYLFREDEGLWVKTHFETALLRHLMRNASSWLDVACGTGYFLAHACGVGIRERAGLDASPAMLAEASAANPGVEFVQADYRQPQPAFENRWDFTSCLWGAYALQETVDDIDALVRNLGRWTAPSGCCYVAIFDPVRLAERRDRGQLRAGMSVSKDGTRWSYVEPGGKRHRELISPPVSVMESLFARHFEAVEQVVYPIGADGGGLVGLLSRKSS